MKKTFIIVVGFLFSSNVFAVGEVNNAKVVAVRADKTGKGYVKFDRTLSGTPASCIKDHNNHLSFDLNTAGGQGIMSVALSAYATGREVRAKGTGTCDEYSVVESWSFGYVR